MANVTELRLTIVKRHEPTNQSQWAKRLTEYTDRIIQAEDESDEHFLKRAAIALEVLRIKANEVG